MTLCHQIANALVADPALLNIRSRLLNPDIRARYGCSYATARNALILARRWLTGGKK